MNGEVVTHDFGSDERHDAERLIAAALAEDWGTRGDITSQSLIEADWQGEVDLVSRAEGVLAGLPLVPLIIARAGEPVSWTPEMRDGTRLAVGARVGSFRGSLRTLLSIERTVLNFLTHLSGIATLTARCVAAAEGTKVSILDTRKTLPGWRRLQKYAVRIGGGVNHRMGLHDAVLIKDNHIAAWSRHNPGATLADLVRLARRRCPDAAFVEIEVDDLVQLEQVLPAQPDIVLLDNFTASQLVEAVAIRDRLAPETLLEASGGITVDRIGEIAHTGIDRISVGQLTHSAPALDLAFDWKA